ncbi:hypothetical protein, partial [Prevotella sp. oral taxon 317]|uniref:hypothetical protein n=1 Tax=Prevotella sp. oral taxon 317 TaxID=652721 RepID=UPI001E3674E2
RITPKAQRKPINFSYAYIEVVLTFNFSMNREEFIIFGMQNQDKHPAHVRSTRQRYDKIRNYAPLTCGKKWLYLENE